MQGKCLEYFAQNQKARNLYKSGSAARFELPYLAQSDTNTSINTPKFPLIFICECQ